MSVLNKKFLSSHPNYPWWSKTFPRKPVGYSLIMIHPDPSISMESFHDFHGILMATGGYDDYWWLHRWRLMHSLHRLDALEDPRQCKRPCQSRCVRSMSRWRRVHVGLWCSEVARYRTMGNDGKWEMSWMSSSNGFSPKLERFLVCISRVRWFRLGTVVICRLSWDQTTFGSIVSGMWCSIGHYVIRAKFVSRCGAAFVSRRWVRSG